MLTGTPARPSDSAPARSFGLPARRGEGARAQRVAVVAAALVITALVVGLALVGGAVLTTMLGSFGP
ncbi:hypothetical protein [Georgenia faecalis]|uniref:Uncharacterized protein n=1 Tax=Georgenia faecalis TaxID=2483799 RepID=A0ABV9D8V8_9MICO|nr:hypothetical protein [Georgenia faecalis]